jgi:hypothetical protein
MQKHLESGVYTIVSAQQSAPSRDAIRAFGREVGCKLPDEFVVHSSGDYGGLYVEVKEELWPRPKVGDVGPFWSFLYGLYTLNLAAGIPEYMDLRANTLEFRRNTGLSLVPCLKLIGSADRYCFDQAGNLGHWDHETNDFSPGKKSFFETLDYELGELRGRKERKCSGA